MKPFTARNSARENFFGRGDRIIVWERLLNVREGVRRADDTLPERILAESRPCDSGAAKATKDLWRRLAGLGCPEPETSGKKPPLLALDPMLDAYYGLRGYTRNGIPTKKTLRRLKIPLGLQEISAVAPRRAVLEPLIVRVFFAILGRALQSASRMDHVFRQELASWPEGFTVLFKVLPFGPRMALRVEGGKRPRYVGDTLWEREAHLTIGFKNMETATRMLTARLSTVDGFAQNRLSVVGDLGAAMRLTRLLDRIQSLLYPEWIAKRVVKRVPMIPTAEKIWKRAWLYLVGIPLGV